MKEIEILAPAGSYESLTAAINASCDAVYIGGTQFGARAYANNLSDDMMLQAIDYVHVHNKKLYLTVNTLLKNSEIENNLYEYLAKYYKQGLDAVIVQDIGAMHFIHEHFIDLDIHASTQMTLTMAQGAETLKHMGITRFVTSRELTLEEIKEIRMNTDLEIEAFVHGALCYCYSGQCLMSSMFGGRSGNRGRCAQPCRMPYQYYDNQRELSQPNEKYLLSPKDICTVDMIPDLIDAGINSFKIEGRMKRPEYTAGVVSIYRKYVDKYQELGKERYESYLASHKQEFDQELLMLRDLYNRGDFTSGYYQTYNGKSMISLNRPNHNGVYVGKVTSVKGNQAKILLSEDLNPQDILEIRDEMSSLYEFTVKNQEKSNTQYTINFMKGLRVNPGNLVYRTKNNSLLGELDDKYLNVESKVPVTGVLTAVVGEKVTLKLSYLDVSVIVEGDSISAAKNQPMTEDKIKKQLVKTNDTCFTFHSLWINIKGEPFIPVQKLNELRREGLQLLYEAIAGKFRRKIPSHSNGNEVVKQVTRYEERHDGYEVGIAVSINSKDQLKVACNFEEVSEVYISSDMVPTHQLLDIVSYVKEKQKQCYIILPHIFRSRTYNRFIQNKRVLEDNTIDGYIIRNYEEFYFLMNELKGVIDEKEIRTDYNLYVMNRQAAAFWNELGIKKFTTPVELNYQELKELTGMYYDIIVYGSQPLMVSVQCVHKTATGSCQNNSSKNNCVDYEDNKAGSFLVDRYQKKMQIKRNCMDCYNTIYNSQPLSLLSNQKEVMSLKPANIRLDFTFESLKETKDILHSFIQVYRYHKSDIKEIDNYTRGHFKRGVE